MSSNFRGVSHFFKSLAGEFNVRGPQRRKRRRSRISVDSSLESLETRSLLTGFVVNTTADVIAVDAFVSLREAIIATNTNTAIVGTTPAGSSPAGTANGDVITFGGPAAGGTISLAMGQLAITDDLRINGTGTTINGAAASRIFNITTAEQVTLTDLVLTNGSAVDGGAVSNATGPLTIGNVQFTSNVASGSGGALFSNSGRLSIANSSFTGNQAVRAGGAIEVNTAPVTMTNTTLDTNSAIGGLAGPGNGGGLHVTGNSVVTVIGGTILNNIAANEGGGLWNSATGTMTVRDAASILSNDAQGVGATRGGGGIFNNGGTLSINTGVVIDNNQASGSQGSGGGIFSTSGNVFINSSTIGTLAGGNTADGNGGGIEMVNGYVILTTSMLDGNTATGMTVGTGNGGGLHISGNATAVFKGTGISGNTAQEEGGGLWNSATGVIIVEKTAGGTPTIIKNNSAHGAGSDQGGGGIFNNGGRLAVNFSTIRDNVADGTLGSGGGIFSVNGRVTIFSSIIAGNTADRAGGGIELVQGNLFVQQTTIGGPIAADANKATGILSGLGNGGGIHVTGNSGVSVDLYNSSIVQGNFADQDGGGLWNQSGSLMAIYGGAQVIDNAAAGVLTTVLRGGGIFNNGGRLDIYGGAAVNGNSAQGTSGQGGGIYNASGSTLTITGPMTTINTNIAQGDASTDGGGGIYNSGGMVTIVAGAILRGNSATGLAGSGGGIFSTSGNVTVNNSTIAANTANRAGGGLEIVAGLVNLNGITLGGAAVADGNIAGGPGANPGNGGGLHTSGNATVNVTGGTIQNNVATNEGGGLWNSATGAMNVSMGAMILSNTAATGGGLFSNGGAGTRVNASTIDSNQATAGDGGGVRSKSGTIRVQNSTVSNNTTSGNGGGLKIDAGVAFIGGTTVSTNTANGAVIGVGVGGGVFIASGALVIGQGTAVIAGNTPDNIGGGGTYAP